MSDFSLYHSIVPSQEDSDPAGERWFDCTTAISTSQLLATSENLDGISEDQISHAHYLVTPPSYTPGSFAQEPVDSSYSQEAMAAATLYGLVNSFQNPSSSEGFPTLVTGDKTPGSISRQNDPTAEYFYSEDQHLPTGLSYSGIYNEERQQYCEEAPQPHDTVVEPRVHVGDTLVPPQIPGAGEHAGQLPPHPVGPEEGQVATLVLAEPSPVTTEVQHPGKRKRKSTSDEEGGEGERRRRPKKPLNPAEKKYYFIPDPAAPPPNRPDILPLTQTEYQCNFEQKGRKRHPPIVFTTHKGVQGINLDDALNMHFPYLDERDDPMFDDGITGNSISLRIQLVGHELAKNVKARQIATKDHRRAHNPITRQKLGHEIAKLIGDHLKKGKGPFRVPFKDMYLVRLHKMSHASWQPELWYKCPQAASTSS